MDTNEYTKEVLELLEDQLDLLEKANNARERTADLPGILYIPAGVTTESVDPAHANYGMPAIVVGGHILHGPQELLDQVKLINFDRTPIEDFEGKKERIQRRIDLLRESLL